MDLIANMNGKTCSCGKPHSFTGQVCIENGAIFRLPDFIKGFKKPFILSDKNTFAAAGKTLCRVLDENKIAYTSYSFEEDALEPDENSVGSAVMHFDNSCDVIIAVGSGVINDIGKILSCISGKFYIIVATAPSMDGYASASSSMTREGLKISLPTRSADVIIGDIDVLKNAPLKMLKSGLGDMLAKYVSICEWRISHLITGEYYCETVADLIRQALKRCVDNAGGLLRREDAAVKAVFEGLVIGGVAMNYAGLSRPASGVEHYISHILDMRGVEFGTPVDFHGIQCAIGTLIATGLYEKLLTITPDKNKALAFANSFDYSAWQDELRRLLGRGAESMIALEAKEKKYDVALHGKRLSIILSHWDDILEIIQQELIPSEELKKLMRNLDMPLTLKDIGVDEALLPVIFKATKDIRDKYVLSRLTWDLGVTDLLI